MPFALIPDGFTLKKVTKLQKQAVTDKRRHDNVMLLIKNPQIITVVTGVVTGAFLTQANLDLDIPDIPNWPEIKAEVADKASKASFAISPLGIPFLGARKGAQLAGQEEAFDEAVNILKGLLP
tara:strand:- start:42 stop:410 length:369 start_codon:yes stop_codon:yes gene_type:complete